MEYEAMELIEMMYSMIAEAKSMPLAAGRCIIERDDMGERPPGAPHEEKWERTGFLQLLGRPMP